MGGIILHLRSAEAELPPWVAKDGKGEAPLHFRTPEWDTGTAFVRRSYGRAAPRAHIVGPIGPARSGDTDM